MNIRKWSQHYLVILGLSVLIGLICSCVIPSRAQISKPANSANDRNNVLAAIDSGDIPALRVAVNKYADVNSVDQTGEPPIIRAAWKGSQEMIRIILDHGGQVNLKDRWHGYSALLIAAKVGSKRCMNELIQRGADKRAISNLGETLLMAAASSGDLDSTTLAARFGTVNHVDIFGRSSLAYAVQGKSISIVKYLLRSGEHVNNTDTTMHSPLHRAALAGHTVIAMVLISAGAKLEAKGDWGDTALIDAGTEINVATLRELIVSGANPNATCDSGRNALMQVCASNGGDGISTPELERKVGEAVRVLLGKTDLTSRDHAGMSAFDIAIQNGHTLAAAVISNHIERQ